MFPTLYIKTLQKPPSLSKSRKPRKKVRKQTPKKRNTEPSPWKHYGKRIAYILVGPLITWPILDEEGPLRFLGLSLLFSGFHLFMLLFVDLLPELDAYLFAEAPIKTLTPRQKKFTKATSVSILVIMGCFLGSIKILDRTIHGMPAFWSCIGIGLLLAVFLVYRSVKKPFSFISDENASRFAIGFLLGIPMLLCSIFFISNRYIVTESIKNKPVRIVEKSIGSGGRRSSDKHYIFLNLDGRTERVTVGKAQFFTLKDTIWCDLSKGIFGYYHINKISSKP